MKVLSAAALLLCCANVHAMTRITAPISVEINQVFAAGNYTYLDLYISPALDQQIESGCGKLGLLESLDVRYTITKLGADSRYLKMTGSVTCFYQTLNSKF